METIFALLAELRCTTKDAYIRAIGEMKAMCWSVCVLSAGCMGRVPTPYDPLVTVIGKNSNVAVHFFGQKSP